MIEHSSKQTGKRIEWIDTIKGFLICCIILGHSNMSISGIFNWFHIPLFFILAGLVLRLPEGKERLIPWIRKKAVRLLIPYITYTFLFWLSQSDFSVHSFIRMVLFNAYGGRIRNVYTVNWYITCLFLSYVILALIDRFEKNDKSRILTLSIMSIIGIIETYTLIPIGGGTTDIPTWLCLPWNIDVCLVFVPLMAIGYYGKKIIMSGQNRIRQMISVKPWCAITGTLISGAIIIVLRWLVRDQYDLFVMKYSRYRMFYIAFAIQICCFILLLFVSTGLGRFRILNGIFQTIGRVSSIIMFTHLIIKSIYERLLNTSIPTMLFLLTSSMVGCALNYLLKRNKGLSIVFGAG